MSVSLFLQTSIVSKLLRHGANPTLLNCNQDKPSGKTFATHINTNDHVRTKKNAVGRIKVALGRRTNYELKKKSNYVLKTPVPVLTDSRQISGKYK